MARGLGNLGALLAQLRAQQAKAKEVAVKAALQELKKGQLSETMSTQLENAEARVEATLTKLEALAPTGPAVSKPAVPTTRR